MEDHDVVVIGGDIAALTAGLVAARHGRDTLVLVPGVPGDHLATIETIEDFPGFPDGVAGYELCPAVQEQAASAGARFAMEAAGRLAADGAGWLIETDAGRHRARAVIIAAGTRPQSLGVPGEERWPGKGLSHCASCDGPLFRGKTVAVVGGGDLALHEALTLARHVARVLLIDRRDTFPAQETYQRRILAQSNVSVRRRSVVEAILGDATITGVRLRDDASGETADVAVDGLFVYVGEEPNTAFADGLLPLDATGRIPTDALMRTALPGVFAAGDVRQGAAGLAVTAAGDGAAAAVAAHRHLLEREQQRKTSA